MSDEVDLKEDLGAVFDQIETEQAEQAARDEKGRFKAKEPEEIPAVEQEAPAEEITDPVGETEADPAPEVQPIEPPERWSAEWKAQFTALPRDAQRLLLEREGEYDKGFTRKSQEAAELKRQLEPINHVLESRRQKWAMSGLTPEQAITQLDTLSDFAIKDPVGFIKQLAAQRGIDLRNLGEAAPAPAPDPVMSRVNSLEQMIQQQQQTETQRQIDAFRAGHEHFEDVRNEMAGMLKAGIASDMQDAYDKACRVNASVSSKLEASRQAEAEAARKAAEARRVEEARQAAARAKKAAGTQLTTRASLNGGAQAPSNMRESMLQAYDQLHGAA